MDEIEQMLSRVEESRREGNIRIPSGCAICGYFSRKSRALPASDVVNAMAYMHDRSNGLGGGFAGYGIYPDFPDHYAFHIFYDNDSARETTESFLKQRFDISNMERIPTKKVYGISGAPLIWRYFGQLLPEVMAHTELDEEEYVCRSVIHINTQIKGAYVFSSGKNMGVFKGVGYPEDVGEYYRLGDYKGYCWTAHGRYPTNTPGWWGGAHPFNILNYTIVHNGEISSYDANRRFMEIYGYKCTLQTDTEVITYIIDYLHRKRRLTLPDVAKVIAPPFWSQIERMEPAERDKLTTLRNMYASLLITGPFSIILGYTGGMMALNDRLKLRSMVAAEKDDVTYVSSEECAIRSICPDPDRTWSPAGGEPVIVELDEKEGRA